MHSCSPVSFRSNTFRLVEIEPITISSLKIKIKGFEIADISVLLSQAHGTQIFY